MIPTFRPTIRRADMDAVLTRLAEDSIGAGALSREFSQNIAKYAGKRSGVSLRSHGHALLAAFRALDLVPGSRIGASVLAHASVGVMANMAGLVVVPIDTEKNIPVLPSPLNFDYQTLDISALYVDTRLGYIPDIENLKLLGIPLIEDISEGLGGNTGSMMVGSVGEMTVVALEPNHIITAGGGAVVLSNNTHKLSALSAMVDERIGEPQLPDMNAALGITQLKQVEAFIERRKDIAARFIRTVQRGRYRVPLQGGEGDNVFYSLPVLVDSSPREVEKYARSHGVEVRRAFDDLLLVQENDRQERSSEESDLAGPSSERLDAFPNALALASKTVLFPLFPTLGKADQEQIERVLATLP